MLKNSLSQQFHQSMIDCNVGRN